MTFIRIDEKFQTTYEQASAGNAPKKSDSPTPPIDNELAVNLARQIATCSEQDSNKTDDNKKASPKITQNSNLGSVASFLEGQKLKRAHLTGSSKSSTLPSRMDPSKSAHSFIGESKKENSGLEKKKSLRQFTSKKNEDHIDSLFKSQTVSIAHKKKQISSKKEKASYEAGNINRAEAAAIEAASLNPFNKALQNVEYHIQLARRHEKITAGILEQKPGEIAFGDALGTKKGSTSLIFIMHAGEKSKINKENDQLRAFNEILSRIECSVRAGHLMYLQQEKKIVTLIGHDPSDYEELKGVSLTQILDALLKSTWVKHIIKKNPKQRKKILSLLLTIQIANSRPRQLAAHNFLKSNMNNLISIITFIQNKQREILKDKEVARINKDTLKQLGIPSDDKMNNKRHFKILEQQPKTLFVVSESMLIDPNTFFIKMFRQLAESLELMERAENNPKKLVQNQLKKYAEAIQNCDKKAKTEKSMNSLISKKNKKRLAKANKKLEAIEKQKTSFQKHLTHLEKANSDGDLMALSAYMFGLENEKLQFSNRHFPGLLKTVLRQYLMINLNQLNEDKNKKQLLKSHLKQLNVITSADEGTLDYQALDHLLASMRQNELLPD